MAHKIFLGGTCNNSTWREELIPHLKVDYFNPVVKNWNEEAQRREKEAKEECNLHLYVISKEMTGVFSIAEAVDSAAKENLRVLFCVRPEGFSESQLKSLKATCNLISNYDGAVGTIVQDIEKIAFYLNTTYKTEV